MDRAAKEDVTSGSAATFSPDTACTRGQMAAFRYRAFAGGIPGPAPIGAGLILPAFRGAQACPAGADVI